MQNSKCLMVALALGLAGMLLLAGAALAQNQKNAGVCPVGQGQVCTGGPGGTCAVTPTPNTGNQNCPGYGAGKSQKQKGMKGPKSGGQAGQPSTPANPSATAE